MAANGIFEHPHISDGIRQNHFSSSMKYALKVKNFSHFGCSNFVLFDIRD